MKKVFAFLFVISFIQRTTAQVNVQTGSATFSLPMFSWQDDKSRLNSSVAMSYNSGSGLKVSEVASGAGQGWNLMAGGVISRLQAGEPDDQKPRDGTIEDTKKYPAGYLYDPLSARDGCPGALASYPLFGDKNHIYKQHNAVAADKELDHFIFQFNGRTGIFILDKSSAMNSNTGSGVMLGDSRVKISFIKDEAMGYYGSTAPADRGVRTTITEFDIQDEIGLVYKFSTHELTKVLKTAYCTASLQEEQTQPKFKHGNVYHEAAFDKHDLVNPYVINSWYLTEIEDVLTHRKILFTYGETRNINSSAGTSLSYYADKDYSMISHKTSVTQTPALTAVLYPDGHNVALNYGAYRVDLNGDKALSSVDVTYLGRYLSKFQLNTSYFILNRYGNPVTDYQKMAARLCLLSVQKYGVDLKATEPPYSFDYHMGSGSPDDFVPPSFFHIKDVWGYYNGDYSHDYDNDRPFSLTLPLASLPNNCLKGLCFLRKNAGTQFFNAKPNYARNGLLKRITYPTGGTLDYDYEQNQAVIEGKFQGQNKIVGGVHVSKTSLTDGGYSNDCNNPIVTNYTYKEGMDDDHSSLWGIELPSNSIKIESNYTPVDKYFHYKFPLSFLCDYHYMYPGIQSLEQSVSLTNMQQVLVAFSEAMNIVGAIMEVIDVINLCLDATPGAIAAVIIDYVATLATIALSCTANLSKDETQVIYYNTDLNSANPLPAQFRRVEVTESTGGNGKTVMEFTNTDDYGVWEPDNRELSMKQRFAHWAYGLPTKTTVYDASGNPVKQTENRYNWVLVKRGFGEPKFLSYPSCKCVVNKTSSKPVNEWASAAYYDNKENYVRDETPGTPLQAFTRGFYTGRIELQNTYERVYKPGSSQYLQTSTQYTYSSDNYQVSDIAVTRSNGDQTVKHITYSNEYHTGAVGILGDNNIISIPVSTTEAVIKNGTYTTQYLGEKVTEFTVLPGGDIKPLRTLEQRLNQPGFISSYNGPGDPANAGKYKVVQSFVYDGEGNLTGMKDEGGHVVSNIYGYNDKYVVASVINADPELDRPAYTSFETPSNSGWLISGSGNFVRGDCVTGTNYFPLSSGTISALSHNSDKSYTLSFWATNDRVRVSGNATLIKSGPSVNSYTYYEYTIAQGSTEVTVSGNAHIDELRFYPKSARMRTVTYDPLIGKTSECDENNRISYFEYDELGRLRFLKDENRNIIKMVEYNYASKKSTNCSITYHNNTIRELFTPSGCPSGYTSDPVLYTIAGGTYSSIISQADADKKAEDDVMANGQDYANANRQCIQVFFNSAMAETFTKQGCAAGSAGTSVTYSVPAGKYTSTVSAGDANQMAQDEIDANGQAFANKPGNAYCTIDRTPDWQATGTPQYQCQTSANGQYTGHQLVLVTDVNPNSNSNPRTQWKDIGLNTAACPAQVTVYAKISYENMHYEPYGTFADIVVRFYSNAACTLPLSVSNLSIYYQENVTCTEGGPVAPASYVSTVSGANAVLQLESLIDYSEPWNGQGAPPSRDCTRSFYLSSHTGYTVVR